MLSILMVAGLLGSVVGGPRSASAAEKLETQCFDVPGITNCLEGQFLTYWRTNGGLPVFGYPITGRADQLNADTGKTNLTQWLERNRMESHPENAGTPYEVLLGLLGKDRLKQLGRDPNAEPREAGAKDGCLWFAETGHNVCDQASGVGFKTYWQSNGLKISGLDKYGQSLQLFGLPLTEPKMETNSSGDTVMTQWFERARFEWHPGNPDQYKVLLGLLGKEVRAGGQPVPPPPPPPADPCAGTPDPVSARVRPAKCAVVGTEFSFDVFGFTPNEEVGFWITNPAGAVVGTRQTVNIGETGAVSGIPFDTDGLSTGIWQWTFQGVSSGHQSVVYMNLLPAGGQTPPPAPSGCGTIPPAQNGSITPNCARGTTRMTITGYGFQANEELGFYATDPSQAVIDLGELLDGPLVVDGSGAFTLYLTVNGNNLDDGVYAITFEGKSSGHKTIVYFAGE
jgi:hypothetical protein